MPAAKKKTETKAKLTKPIVSETISNPILDEFDTMVEQVRNAVKDAVDFRRKNNDDSQVTIMHYTDDVIRAILRASRWA